MEKDVKSRKSIAYLAHPISGDVEGNIESILCILKEIRLNEDDGDEWRDIIPVAPYITALHYLDDNVPEERALGMEENSYYFEKGFIDELLLAGPYISSGMRKEIELAHSLGLPISCYNPALQEELNQILDGLRQS